MAALRIPHTIGSSAVIGSTDRPELWALVSYDDASEPTPEWVTVTADVRSFSTSRGRESEFVEMDAGTATVVLDNRDNDYDPSAHSYVRPMNGLWLREQFDGDTNDIFKGYVESWDQQWPGGGKDAICVAQAVDEFKPLALDALPVTDPPRDTYADVILTAQPVGYWRLDDDDPLERKLVATVGDDLVSYFAGTEWSPGTPSPIVGDDGRYQTTTTGSSTNFQLSPADQGTCGDFTGQSQGAIEAWVRFSALPAANNYFLYFGQGSVGNFFGLRVNTTGAFAAQAKNTVPTTFTVTSPATYLANTWYHVVAQVTGGNLELYVNGALVATTAFTGAFPAFVAPSFFQCEPSTTITKSYDEIVIYRAGLNATTIANHYTAGTSRGFPQQDVAERIGAVLDSAGNHAPRYLRPASRDIRTRRMHGQPPLEEMRLAREAEADSSVLFVAADGTLTFLDAGHRIAAPWSTVQATFTDIAGPGIPYTDIDVDYSDAFLFNEWNVTNVDGTLQTASDATSIARYGKRSQNLTTQNVSDGDASNVAAAMLAKYKDPFQRVTSITVAAYTSTITDAVFALELCDKIRVIRTLPGGGTFDQTLYVQKIEVTGTPGEPWRVKLGVSPL